VTYSVSGLSGSEYLVMLNLQSYTAFPGSGHVRTKLVTYDAVLDIISISAVGNLQTAAATGYIRSTKISATTAMVAFSDANFDYGIRGTLVTKSINSTGITIEYGASYLFSRGYTLDMSPGGAFMDFDIASFGVPGISQGVIALFSDASNQRRVTIAAAMVVLFKCNYNSIIGYVFNYHNDTCR
jgi:hypothetical protein